MASISFQPAAFNVLWDGTSEAKLSVKLACYDTAASYSATSLPVWARSGRFKCTSGTVTQNFTYYRGETRFTTGSGCTKVPSTSSSLPLTVSGAGVATVNFSGLSGSDAWYWEIKATKSGTTRVLVAGSVEVPTFNAYRTSSPSFEVVSGVTAAGCF